MMGGLLPLGEAVALGLASGPACVASCGPVVVPTMLAEGPGWRAGARYLATFLGTRLLGYLIFAGVAWKLGRMTVADAPAHARILGAVHLLLAAALVGYAWSAGRPCDGACAGGKLLAIAPEGRRGVPGAALLGFLTGISLCPPFLAAGVRAAELGSLGAALLFFGVFSLGTAAWFVPLAGLAAVRRSEAVTTVARMAMVVIAAYYVFIGSAWLLGGGLHVR